MKYYIKESLKFAIFVLCFCTVFYVNSLQADMIKIDSDGNSIPSESSAWSCVYDTQSKLLWEIKTPENMPKVYTWSEAKQYAENLNLCGKTGWRLPTKAELEAMVFCPKKTMDWRFSYQCDNNYRVAGKSQDDGMDINIIKPDLFPNTAYADPNFNANDGNSYDQTQLNSQPKLPVKRGVNDLLASYWSATIYPDIPDSAWYVDFRTGAKTFDGTKTARHVRAVKNVENLNAPITKAITPKFPTWDASNNVLTIPQFDSAAPFKSAKIRFNFGDSTFDVLDAQTR